MICMECSCKEFCYASNIEMVECDPFAEGYKREYKIYWDRLNYLDELKLTATGVELRNVLAEIDQLEDFIIYTASDMALGPREESDEMPF